MCITRQLRCAAVIALIMPAAVVASNGINLTGYGAESSVMGGADIALARDTTAPGTNPAGLTQTGRRAFDEYQPLQSVHYDTPGGVFGEEAEERNEAFLFHFMIGRRW